MVKRNRYTDCATDRTEGLSAAIVRGVRGLEPADTVPTPTAGTERQHGFERQLCKNRRAAAIRRGPRGHVMDCATALDRRRRQSRYQLRLASAGASTKYPVLQRRPREGCADSSGCSINAAQTAAWTWPAPHETWYAQPFCHPEHPAAKRGFALSRLESCSASLCACQTGATYCGPCDATKRVAP